MAYFRGRALEMEEKAKARLRIRNVRGKGQGSSLVRVKTYSVQMFSTASVILPFLRGVECWLLA